MSTSITVPFFAFSVLFFSLVSTQALNDINLEHFLPHGSVVFEKYTGDLNSDGVNDYVIVTKKTDNKKFVINRFDKRVDRNSRGLLILLSESNNY